VNERSWRKHYQAALSERDLIKLENRICDTEGAIFLSLQTLANSPDFWSERKDIVSAIATLRRLQVEKLHFPDWNPHR
jgi:hypothetical protein